jgi:hypothetical protein
MRVGGVFHLDADGDGPGEEFVVTHITDLTATEGLHARGDGETDLVISAIRVSTLQARAELWAHRLREAQALVALAREAGQ